MTNFWYSSNVGIKSKYIFSQTYLQKLAILRTISIVSDDSFGNFIIPSNVKILKITICEEVLRQSFNFNCSKDS